MLPRLPPWSMSALGSLGSSSLVLLVPSSKSTPRPRRGAARAPVPGRPPGSLLPHLQPVFVLRSSRRRFPCFSFSPRRQALYVYSVHLPVLIYMYIPPVYAHFLPQLPPVYAHFPPGQSHPFMRGKPAKSTGICGKPAWITAVGRPAPRRPPGPGGWAGPPGLLLVDCFGGCDGPRGGAGRPVLGLPPRSRGGGGTAYGAVVEVSVGWTRGMDWLIISPPKTT